MTRPSKRLSYLLLASAMVAGAGGLAVAQTTATYDPAQLPATKGRVAQYSLTPRGDVDGLILDDGTEVHMPPHLGTQLVFAVKPGDTVTVHGLKARELPMVQAMQVTNDASHQSVTDTGPGGPGAARPPGPPRGPGFGRGEAGQPMEAQGTVKAQLHGPRGDLNGVLLTDGTIVRMPPPEAQRLAAQLASGQPIFVRGDGMASPLGRVVEAHEIGATAQQLSPVQGPHGHGGPRRGPGAPPPPVPGQDAPPR